MKRMNEAELSTRIAQFMQRKSVDYPELLAKYAKPRGEIYASDPAHGSVQTSRIGFVY